MNVARLAALFEQYISNDSYYYDVVGWFDQVLHAPTDFSKVFRREISEPLLVGLEGEVLNPDF